MTVLRIPPGLRVRRPSVLPAGALEQTVQCRARNGNSLMLTTDKGSVQRALP